MKMLMPKRHGFTVVELLVVIVVIGILAAITIVSYLWLNRDAHTAHIVVNVSQYTKSLDIYKSKYGQYPASTSTSCIGQYPEINNMPANVCYRYGSTNSSTVSASVNSELAKVGMSPTIFDNAVERTIGSTLYLYRGIRYYSPSSGASYSIYYYLPSGEDCGVPGVSQTNYTDYTYCYLSVS